MIHNAAVKKMLKFIIFFCHSGITLNVISTITVGMFYICTWLNIVHHYTQNSNDLNMERV